MGFYHNLKLKPCNTMFHLSKFCRPLYKMKKEDKRELNTSLVDPPIPLFLDHSK